MRLVTGSNLLVTTTPAAIDSMAISRVRSAKYLIQAIGDGQHQVSEILMLHDGSAANITEYGAVFTGAAPIVLFSADVTGGDMRLKCMSLTTSARIWFQRTTIESITQES